MRFHSRSILALAAIHFSPSLAVSVSNGLSREATQCDTVACGEAIKKGITAGGDVICGAANGVSGDWPGAVACLQNAGRDIVEGIDIKNIVECAKCSYIGACERDQTALAKACGEGTDRGATEKLVVLPDHCINLIAGRGLVIPGQYGGYKYGLTCGNKVTVTSSGGVTKRCEFDCYNCPQRMDIVNSKDYTDDQLKGAGCW